MIVLDTHVLIWLFEGDEHLGSRTARMIAQSIEANDTVGFSIMTIWEIAMLHEKGRLILSRPLDAWVEAVVAHPGLQVMPIEPRIAIECNRLPAGFHPDPADRLIAATARCHDMTLLTADRAILAYSKEGHIRCFNASL